MKFMFGGATEWTGKDIKELHMPLKITEEHFDLYKSTFTSQLKSLKVRPAQLKQICLKMEGLREQIVWDG